MLCSNCAKLAALQTNKTCMRCQAPVYTNISSLCNLCSDTLKKCAVCIKTVMTNPPAKGCNCGKK